MNDLSNILAIIVIYKTDFRTSATFQSILSAVRNYEQDLDLLIYDNSPEVQLAGKELKYENINIHYTHDPNNSGVSAAYNYGAKYASEMPSKQWLLLLDQDTTFNVNLISRYLEAFKAYPDAKLFAPILRLKSGILFSPCKFVFKRGFPLKEIQPGPVSLDHISPVNSGMMIHLSTFFSAGMYNEAVKLDYSDFQFIERFKALESSFVVIDSTAYQDFSNEETDVKKLNVRYAYFCEGAKNFEKFNVVERMQFFIVALMRAVTLSYRNKSLIFFKTFFKEYIQ